MSMYNSVYSNEGTEEEWKTFGSIKRFAEVCHYRNKRDNKPFNTYYYCSIKEAVFENEEMRSKPAHYDYIDSINVNSMEECEEFAKKMGCDYMHIYHY